MKRVLLIFFLIVIIMPKSFAQYAKGQMKEDFYWAETFILYEEYSDALTTYLRLLRLDPKNDNYRYRIGQCLINITGRKQEAVSYLEAAVKNIDPDYKEGKFKETGAPFDAYYYLANAYRINNQLDKAIETYEIFKKNLDPKVYDTVIVNQQIESCRNARELMKVPLYIRKVNLGDTINTQYSDINPVISGDQKVLVFNRLNPFQEALMYTRKINGRWSEPRNIIPDLGLGWEAGNYATSLSNDGRELYIYRRGDDYDGNIFVTKRISDDKWSNLIRLNDNINTKYWESHASVSHDGKKLYFTSNRKDAIGGLDIYVSERDSGDAWKPARNLGPVINTIYNEDTPFLGKDDKTIFFSSRGHFNIGGYDIFYSTFMDNGQWSVPLNVGYPLNTTDEDIFFDPVNDGYQAYYAMMDPDGFGESDIYRIEIFSKDHPRKFFVRGLVQVKDLMAIFGDSIKVSTFDQENPDSKIIVYTNPLTGEYKFELPQGKYTITYQTKGGDLLTKNFELQLDNPSDSFVLPNTTLPKSDFTADLDVGDKKNISVVKGDTILFPLKVEKNSILEVEHWLGDSLLYTEKFIINDTTFLYKAVPRDGKNRIVFKLTDKYSNITTAEIDISKKKFEPDQTVVRPEYSHVIARKQINSFIELLKKRSDFDLNKIIDKRDLQKQKFANVDDIISYLKEQAVKKNIDPKKLEPVPLKVAVMDNVLSQAATNLVAASVDCQLKEILMNLNIYDAGLKTWTDLQKYIEEKTAGKIKPEDMNRIAADILTGIDPSIFTIRQKLTSYSNNIEKGSILKEALASTDKKKIAEAGAWLREVTEQLYKSGLAEKDISLMLTSLTSVQGTSGADYLTELEGYSEEPLLSQLKNTDPVKNKLKWAFNVDLYLLKNRNTGRFHEDALFKALSRMISCKDLPEGSLKPQIIPGEGSSLVILWIFLGAAFIFFIFIFWKRRRKDKKE